MSECCENCQFCLDLEKCDYSKGGCIHSSAEGYICIAFKDDGVAMWMIGNNRNTGMCECYTPITDRTRWLRDQNREYASRREKKHED